MDVFLSSVSSTVRSYQGLRILKIYYQCLVALSNQSLCLGMRYLIEFSQNVGGT